MNKGVFSQFFDQFSTVHDKIVTDFCIIRNRLGSDREMLLQNIYLLKLNIQFRKMNMDHLLNKPYVDEVALTEQNLY